MHLDECKDLTNFIKHTATHRWHCIIFDQLQILAVYLTHCLSTLQVAWLGTPEVKVSWERACNINASVIKEFEDGDVIQTADDVCSGYGKNAYTTTVSVETKQLAPKKMRVSCESEKELDSRYVAIACM